MMLAALAAGAMSLLTTLPSVARADANAEARIFFESGNRHLSRGLSSRGPRRENELTDALRDYASSLRIVRSRNVVFNTAIALEALGRLVEAHGYFNEYVTMEGLAEGERAEGARRLEALRARLGRVLITTEPAGAEVRVDREDLAPLGRTPFEVVLEPGAHRLFVVRAGYAGHSLEVEARAGERAELSLRLDPLPVSMRISSPTGSRATLDGEPVAINADFSVAAGPHAIVVEGADGGRLERRVVIEAGSDPVVLDLIPPPAPPPARARIELSINNPMATISLGGRRIGVGPRLLVEASPGTHHLLVEAADHLPYEREIELEPGQHLRIGVTLSRASTGETRLGIVPEIALVATGILGLVFAFQVGNVLEHDDDWLTARDAHNAAPTDETLLQANLAADELEEATERADILFGVTLGLGAATLVLYLLDTEEEAPPSTASFALVPTMGGVVAVASMPWSAQ